MRGDALTVIRSGGHKGVGLGSTWVGGFCSDARRTHHTLTATAALSRSAKWSSQRRHAMARELLLRVFECR